jgi:membrane-associated protein
MDFLALFWDWIVHLDVHLGEFVKQHGVWVYALLFVIVFCETGLVVTPFLPGDSLLFVAGTLAALGEMNIFLVSATLIAAALCGDNCNYWIGRWAGMRLFGRWINPVYLQRTHEFYERHGGKTIILARFVPIVRTFITLMAGVGRMSPRTYLVYSAIGAVLWGVGVTMAGYWLGQFDLIKNNIDAICVLIVLVSVAPMALHYLADRSSKRRAAAVER